MEEDGLSIRENIPTGWLWVGAAIGIANVLFIALLVILLEYDPLVGLGVAVAASVGSGWVLTVLALGQR